MKLGLAAAGLVSLIAWLALPGSPAHACTCDVVPVSQQLAGADAVFKGEVLSVTPADAEHVAELRVLLVYKGDVDPVVDVRAASTPDACGLQFARRSEYLVFARGASDGYTTSLCAGTTDDLAALERNGYSGRPVVATASVAESSSAGAEPVARTLPVAAASGSLGAVLLAHLRRFKRARLRRATLRAHNRA